MAEAILYRAQQSQHRETVRIDERTMLNVWQRIVANKNPDLLSTESRASQELRFRSVHEVDSSAGHVVKRLVCGTQVLKTRGYETRERSLRRLEASLEGTVDGYRIHQPGRKTA